MAKPCNIEPLKVYNNSVNSALTSVRAFDILCQQTIIPINPHRVKAPPHQIIFSVQIPCGQLDPATPGQKTEESSR